tara:strand:+ start:5664 stop:5960 length:297 start_codon:yes stop_codon:yes gene_type:complete
MTEDPRDYIGKNYESNLDEMSLILRDKFIFGKDHPYLRIDEYEGPLYPKCYYKNCSNHSLDDIENTEISIETDDRISRYFFHGDCLDYLIGESLTKKD